MKLRLLGATLGLAIMPVLAIAQNPAPPPAPPTDTTAKDTTMKDTTVVAPAPAPMPAPAPSDGAPQPAASA